jgi:diguanylate cyclase (GGDEF)-like protein/PAS domain S-box-containing protein
MGEQERGGRPVDLDEFWTQLVACHNDVPALLRVIANRVVDLFGNGCVLTLVSPDGQTLQPKAVVHADPAVGGAMRIALAADEARIGEGLAGTVAADRRSILLNDLTPHTVAETTPQQFLPFVRDHPIRAIMIAPLVASGELVGTLGSVRTDSGEPYTAADLRLLEALAERAALAVAEVVAGPRAIGPTDFEAIYRYNLDGVLIATPDGHILGANPAACSILGVSEREIIDGGRQAWADPSDPRVHAAVAERAVSGRMRSELSMRKGDGSTFAADVSSVIYTTPEGKVRAVFIFRDVSDRAVAQQMTMARLAELEHAADRDPLTGLWNRRGFRIAAEQALATADRDRAASQLVFVDLDGLKAINDERGHAAGDDAIRAVASAVERAIREPDVACRLGGDEFVVLLVGTPSDEVPRIIDRIAARLRTDEAHPLTFSTGVVERPAGDQIDLDELIDAADRDMYQQKVVHRLRRDR